jgi:membrane fusion protein (multidrug efflux system)
MNSKNIIAWIVVSLLPLLAGCKKKDPTPNGVAVKTLCVRQQDYTTYYRFTIKIESQQNIDIRPVVGGRLQKICVQEGSEVKKGQPLFVLDQAPYKAAVHAAEAQVATARASLSTASLNLEGKEQLYAQKMVGEFDLRRARHAHEETVAQFENAQAELARARANLDYTTIICPADGRISIIEYRVGDVIFPDLPMPMAILSVNSHLYAYTSLSEEMLSKLLQEYDCQSPSQLLTKLPAVTLHAIWGEEHTLTGRIDAISGSTSKTTASLLIRASFDNPSEIFRNGSNGFIDLPSILHHVYVVPSDAVVPIQDKYFIYRVIDGKAVSTEVKAQPSVDKDEYIVTSGLHDGDIVIAEHADMMSEGIVVIPQK